MRNKEMEQNIIWILTKLRIPSGFMGLIYIIISPILCPLEEIIGGVQAYQSVRSVVDFCEKEWKDLTEEEKIKMGKYYEAVERKHDRKQHYTARESSIQLIYQLTLVVYSFRHAPMLEMDYTSDLGIYKTLLKIDPRNIANRQWIKDSTFVIISILLSAYSTFTPILDNVKFKNFKKNKSLPSIYPYITKILQTVFHLIFAILTVYLVWSKIIFSGFFLNIKL